MIIVKWRIDPTKDFEYYTEIYDNNFKKCRGPILLDKFINEQKFEFRFIKSDTSKTSEYICDDKIIIECRPNKDFYFVDGGFIVVCDKETPNIVTENFNEFRIDNQGWNPITKIDFNLESIFDNKSNIFIPHNLITRKYIEVIQYASVVEFNLIRKEYVDFINVFRNYNFN